jgi:BirA family biotin operon repressor/biotin-[acetyl-CoA-carboxylase] ligase
MLAKTKLTEKLPIAGLGGALHYFKKLGSTNAYAAQLAGEGAPHGALIVTEDQTHGRGRAGRTWLSKKKSSLTFSLLLRPDGMHFRNYRALPMLGSLSLVEALEGIAIRAEIKWPNDVLMESRKVAGVLVESSWTGSDLDYSIIGWGINVGRKAIPKIAVEYPAGCLADFCDEDIDLTDLLAAILERFGAWIQNEDPPELPGTLERVLAFRGQQVRLGGESMDLVGTVIGLTSDGELRLETLDGEVLTMGAGDIHLRPIDTAHE